jgi:endonuclease YncB( thermonuclease family)
MALALFLSWLSIAQAAAFTGQVVRVLDGDTFEVLHNQHPERIRLSGIDWPEKGQSFDLLADRVAVSDKRVVAITRGGARRVAGIRLNTTGVIQPSSRARARTGRQHDEARLASIYPAAHWR